MDYFDNILLCSNLSKSLELSVVFYKNVKNRENNFLVNEIIYVKVGITEIIQLKINLPCSFYGVFYHVVQYIILCYTIQIHVKHLF